MSFNRTLKYFRTIRAYVFCDICQDVIHVDINKDDIRNGLQTGLYIYKYKHKNPKSDPDDPSDESWKEHTSAIYINAQYEVSGLKNYLGDAPELEKGTQIPVVIKEIPPMSVHLGMLSPEEYRVLQTCDGINTLESVGQIVGISIENLEKMMNKLKDKGLVSIIKRS